MIERINHDRLRMVYGVLICCRDLRNNLTLEDEAMTDDQKKMLTEWLEEKEIDYSFSNRVGLIRTFTTWQDLGAVKEALVKKAKKAE